VRASRSRDRSATATRIPPPIAPVPWNWIVFNCVVIISSNFHKLPYPYLYNNLQRAHDLFQLKNVIYIVSHIQKEIKCFSFNSFISVDVVAA
jgi:hypothetical protein